MSPTPPHRAATRPLEGEDLGTQHWEDARHWVGIYDDLIRFKLGLLARVEKELPKLHPVAHPAVHEDTAFIRSQMEGYYERLDLWYQRIWTLRGPWIDPDSGALRHEGGEVTLTKRESELFRFLLAHPHRYYTAAQIATHAWSDAGLAPEEVRNYIARLRRILTRLRVPCNVVNNPGRGYSLTFQARG